MSGSYDRLPSGRWRGRVTIAGKSHSVTTDTRRDAIAEVAAIVAEAARRGELGGRRRSGAAPTVAAHLDRWVDERARDLAESTIIDYRRVIDRYLVPAVGATLLPRLHQSDLSDLYSSMLADGIGPARIRRVHNVMASALEQAVQDDIVPANVARKARTPKVTEREIDPPTPGEVARVLSVADTIRPGLAMFVQLAAVTGARRAELVALRWADVDTEQGAVVISRAISAGDPGDPNVGAGLIEKDTKTHAARRIALDGGTIEALRTHTDRQQDHADEIGVDLVDNPRVFSDHPAADLPWRPDTVSRAFSDAVAAADIGRRVRLHDLRHAAATQMLAAGVDVKTGANRLGHARADTFLNRYAHAVPAADAAAADTLANIYRTGEPA